ncbi:MAG: DUF565 domain-containing protein [Prochlorococcus sp.]|nr:DUF565 domain-containing protein [Prochlorococcaceae cyanobacterium ETNP2_MAG_10]MDP6195845.1 DUF565 domain-containing protein [Prochlorococcaceae cyanobacterium ETNP18_MAG_17]MDP6320928.1 DUF565 domain-containing protein [Prochlorococcaceae cyanobacterium ETNP14_MAG_5]HJL68969.1 DUF565 domain-containing protein [Prochlorococcaceae cyanobacterium Gl_MAG_24]
MLQRLQSTRLHRSVGQAGERLELWAINPWRRSSLFLIVLLTAFLLGSSIGTISGALDLMDPIGALFTVMIWEAMVRLRRQWPSPQKAILARQLLDMARIGLLYGLLLEGFKLL